MFIAEPLDEGISLSNTLNRNAQYKACADSVTLAPVEPPLEPPLLDG